MTSALRTAADLHADAADALAAALPGAYATRPATDAEIAAVAGRDPAAVVAAYVGEQSADLVLVLDDLAPLLAAAGADAVAAADVVRPAFERAAAVLGTGLVADIGDGTAGQLLADPATRVFAVTLSGVLAGWFAMRLRGEQGAPVPDDELAGRLGRISSVEMALTVEIGRTRMAVRDVLGLQPGSVVELDRSAGSPADILLNGRLIAHGEVVVVDQEYAVRVTTILDTADGLR